MNILWLLARWQEGEVSVLVFLKEIIQSRDKYSKARIYWPQQKHTQDKRRKGLAQKQQEIRLRLGCLGILGRQRKGGLGDRFMGLAQEEPPLSTAPLVASLAGTLRV